MVQVNNQDRKEVKMKIHLAAALTLLCACAWAVEYTWNGGTSGEWTMATNWLPNSGYPNADEDTATFAVREPTAVTVGSAVAVKGMVVSGTATLTLTGAQITLGDGGIVSTSRNDIDVSNAIRIFDPATPLVNCGSLDASVDRTIAGPFRFRGEISGAGGIAKSGRGDIHLYCANHFEGVFSSRAEVVDGFPYRGDGWFVSNTSSASTSPTYGSSDVHIYDCGALGCQMADLGGDGNYGTQLWVKAPGTIEIPVFVSKTFAMCGQWLVYTRDIIFTGFTGAVRFSANVYNEAANDCFEIRSVREMPIDVHFDGYVFSNYGTIYFYTIGSGGNFHLHRPMAAGDLDVVPGLTFGYQNDYLVSDCQDVGMHFYGQNPTDAARFQLKPGINVFCEAENVLPAKIDELKWWNDETGVVPMFIDLKGNDQLISQFNASKYTEPDGITSYGFTSPADQPARISYVGLGIPSFGFHGMFKGAAGLKWDPQSDSTLTLTQAISPTAGEVEVKSGKVLLSDGYGFTSLSSVKIAADAVLEIDATANVYQKTYAMELTSGGTGGLRLGRNVTLTVNTLSVDGGYPLPVGVYTKDSVALAGTLSGEGVIEVGRFGLPCGWSGAASGDWNDPGNWSIGRVPDETHDVTIGAAAVTVNGSAPKVRELFLDSGSTLLFTNGFSSIEADAIIVGAGATVTVSGSCAEGELPSRVWLKCVDLMVMAGGGLSTSAAADGGLSTARQIVVTVLAQASRDGGMPVRRMVAGAHSRNSTILRP